MRRSIHSHLVGVISDTHGLVRPEAIEALAGVEHILHAGDIGSPEVLTALEAIAPVTAVRGNNDRFPTASDIPETAAVEIGSQWFYILHDLHDLDLDPRAAGFAAVITGHSHRPLVEEKHGVLFVNPGSAGPRRFRLPVAVARMRIEGAVVTADVVSLSC
jgi:putative phosphoesterase